jgi:hypothetical protein
MNISVKGSKTKTPDPQGAELYTSKSDSTKSALPYAIGGMLTALALYLKSIFPAASEVLADIAEDQPDISPTKKEPASAAPRAVAQAPETPQKPGKTAEDWLADENWAETLVNLRLPPLETAHFLKVTTLALPHKMGKGVVPFTADGLWHIPPAANSQAPVSKGPSPDRKNDPVLPSRPRQQEEGKEDPQRPNRAPRNSEPVPLFDLAGGAIGIIFLSQLLRYSTDPDGDRLWVQDIQASSGQIIKVGDRWHFTSDDPHLHEVTLTYLVTDGSASTLQTAFFQVAPYVTIIGTDGDDLLVGTSLRDEISGGDGDDLIHGGGGNDILFGGAGNDNIFGGDGDDLIFGGPGDDVIFGGAGNDRIYGGAGNDRIHGGDGDDILFGEDGDDWIDGGAGDDIIFGGPGNDTLIDGAGRDHVFGGDGNDTFLVSVDGDDDFFDGGSGWNILDLSATTAGVVVDTTTGHASGSEIGQDSFINMSQINGGTGDDYFILGDQAMLIHSGGGDNLFEFLAPGQQVVHEIHNFRYGDTVKISEYKLFKKIIDEMEDQFEAIYGKDIDAKKAPIIVRHEKIDDTFRTIIEADINRDDSFETIIFIEGHHVLAMTEVLL